MLTLRPYQTNQINKTMKTQMTQVQKTTDYTIFKTISGNRGVNKLHLNRLKNSIRNKYLFTVIIVNDKFQIIDGQHRFQVIKELNLPLNYIVCKGYGLEEVQILNQNSKNWSTDDFMNGYCNMGLSDYIIYRDFIEKYKFGHNECQAMLQGKSTHGGQISIEFKDGNFKATHYDEACVIADKISMIKEYYAGYNKRAFVLAMLSLFNSDVFDIHVFIQKLKNQRKSLVDCVSRDQYIMLIEEIYNYKRRDKVSLRY